jgi:hypothetical protein
MTYQGDRARPMASENGRFFEVTKVRVGTDGHVSDVLWSEVDVGADHDVSALTVATSAEVVDAIHDGAQVAAVFASSAPRRPDRRFVIVEHADGRECITLEGAPSAGRDLGDIDKLDS